MIFSCIRCLRRSSLDVGVNAIDDDSSLGSLTGNSTSDLGPDAAAIASDIAGGNTTDSDSPYSAPSAPFPNDIGGCRIFISSIGKSSGIPIYAKLMYIISSSGYVRISIISSSMSVINPVITVGKSPPNRISTHVETTK